MQKYDNELRGGQKVQSKHTHEHKFYCSDRQI